MRYVATLTDVARGSKESKIFDVVHGRTPGEGRHPKPEAFMKIAQNLFGRKALELTGLVTITSNEDPKFKLELI